MRRNRTSESMHSFYLHRDLTREQLELAEKEVSELRNRQEQSAGEARSAVDIVAEKNDFGRDRKEAVHAYFK